MKLSESSMQQIVEELRDTINKDINIMDNTGCIVAATDPSRVGMYHMGAQKIIAKKMSELLIDDAQSFGGSKKGINLPIYINDELIGVVGITGERKEVEPFGKVIKKMTEILITEEYQKEQTHLIENTINNFVYNWIFKSQDEDSAEGNKFMLSGELLGIDVQISRAVIVMNIDCVDKPEDLNDVKRQSLYNRIINRIRINLKEDKQNIVVEIGGSIIILLHEDSLDRALERVKAIAEGLEKHYNIKIAGGIGSVGVKPVEIRQSYKEADISCNIMSKFKDKGIKLYSDVDLELLLQTVPYHSKMSFYKKIFSNCSNKEIDNYVSLIRTLIENNGAIGNTAEQLFLHKNTVQYRLNKLKDATGYDPRNMKEIVPLYIAMLIYEEGNYVI